MGMYDEVWLHCPRCKAEHYEQSKSGPCKLKQYKTIGEAPPHVLGGLCWPEDVFECEQCGSRFRIKATFIEVVE